MGGKNLFMIAAIILSVNLIYASQYGYDSLITTSGTTGLQTTYVNINSTTNNNSIYWDGHSFVYGAVSSIEADPFYFSNPNLYISSYTETDPIFSASNSTIVRTGNFNCSSGTIQNVTINSSGIFGQCVTSTGAYNITYQNKADYQFDGNSFNGTGSFTTGNNSLIVVLNKNNVGVNVYSESGNIGISSQSSGTGVAGDFYDSINSCLFANGINAIDCLGNVLFENNLNVTGNITMTYLCNATNCYSMAQLLNNSDGTGGANYNFDGNNFNGTGNFTTTGYISGNGSKLNSVCLSNGTGCPASSGGFTTDQNNQLNTTGSPTFKNLSIKDASGNYVTTISGSSQPNNISYTLPQTNGFLGIIPKSSGTNNWNGVSSVNSSLYYVCGNAGTIRRLNLNFVTLTSSGLNPSGASAVNFSSISCPDYNHCFAVGTNGKIYYNSVAYTSNTWTSQTSNAGTLTFSGISCPDTTHCWAVGFNNTASYIDVTSNGGTTWTFSKLTSCTPTTSCNAVNIQMINNTYGFFSASGGTGGVFKTTDGSTWSSSGSFAKAFGLHFINANQGCIGTSINTMWTTSNGGATWSGGYGSNGMGLGSVNYISCPVDLNTLYEGTNAHAGNLLYTNTGGLTTSSWTNWMTGTASGINNIAMADNFDGVLVGNNGYYGVITPYNQGVLLSTLNSTSNSPLTWSIPTFFQRNVYLSGQGLISLTQPNDIYIDSYNFNIFAPENRLLYNQFGDAVIGFSDPNEIGGVGISVLVDGTNLPSVDVNNRKLIGSDGATTSLSWADNQVTVGSANTGTYDGKGLCYVNNGEIGHCTSVMSVTGDCTCAAN